MVVSLFSRDNMDKSLYTQVHCGLEELKNLLDERDLQPECQVAPRGCWTPGHNVFPPGIVFCIMGHRVCIGWSLRGLLSVRWELSSLRSANIICIICIWAQQGWWHSILGQPFGCSLILQSANTFLGFNCKGRKRGEAGRGYWMISFTVVLVFIGYSLHILLLSGLAPASLEYYSP